MQHAPPPALRAVDVPPGPSRPTLAAFALRHFRPPLASAAHLARALDAAHFAVNGAPETRHARRLAAGDTVALRATQAHLDALRFRAPPLAALRHRPPHYVVLEKPPGMPPAGAKPDSLAAALPRALAALAAAPEPPPRAFDVVAAVGRSTAGPAVVALSAGAAAELRADLAAGRFRFTFRLIVHGAPPPALPQLPGFLSLRRLATHASTVGALTSVDLTLSTDGRGVRRALSDAGAPVLGRGALMRPSKASSRGAFMACTRLVFPDRPAAAASPGAVVDISLPPPPKFQLLLARERRCFDAKAERATAGRARAVTMRDQFLLLLQRAGGGARPDAGAADCRAAGAAFVEFCGAPLLVTSAVMAPRASSETLVDAALARLTEWARAGAPACACDCHRRAAGSAPRRRPRVLDLGVGSGALLVATLRGIRSSCPGASGVGLDVSADALAIARANVVAHGLSARVRLVRGDFCDLSAVGAAGDGRDAPGGFDVLLCNPPYLTAAEAGREGEGLQGPDVALIAGDSRDTRIDPAARRGLACYEAVARGIGAAASSLIRSGGRLVVELGGKRSASGVQHLFELHAGLQVEAARKDAIGLTRCLVFKQPRACCPC